MVSGDLALSRLLLDRGRLVHAVAGDGELGAALAAAGRRDVLAVPIPSADGPIGVLAVYDRSGFTEQDRSDEAVLLGLARELGAAVQRSALVAEIVAIRRDAARIVDTSLDGIVALGEDGTVVTWNQAFADLTGYPPEKMLGDVGLALLDVRDGDGSPVRLECWPSGAALPPDLVVRTVDGQRRWLSCTYSRATRDVGSGPLLVVMARDVTDLRHQDRLLAEQAGILELVASDAPLTRSLDAVAALVQSLTDAAAAVLLASLPPGRRVPGGGAAGRPGRPGLDAPAAGRAVRDHLRGLAVGRGDRRAGRRRRVADPLGRLTRRPAGRGRCSTPTGRRCARSSRSGRPRASCPTPGCPAC